jgi:hypothetical protein
MSSGFRQGPSRSMMLLMVTSPMVSVCIVSCRLLELPSPHGPTVLGGEFLSISRGSAASLQHCQ